ncbi:MAG: DUF2207 domain-containing protein [Pseudomonadota bacterium]|nr:DUF2207 domain-containing protein [Pseudomonadota bacterium]
MPRLLGAVIAALLALLLTSPALAEERILSFVSDVQIRPDATLDVTETIAVRAENVRINRGIYRDFPTRYRGRNGSQVRVGFTLQDVTRNGALEPAAIEPISNGVRIRIGSPERMLDQGEHRYVIRYRTTRQIGRFGDYDELYWNATGNGWAFPIDLAEVRLRLPKQMPFGQRAFYTGAQDEAGQAAEVVEDQPGEIRFRTTAPLDPHEGLTVAAAFPKGVVGEPDEASRSRWLLADYGPLIVGALGLIGLAIFYYFAWARAGRNPRPGTVVPIFSPPHELTPAGMRYIWKMGADDRAFAAALVDMGVRGHVRMVEEDGGFLSRDKVRLERVAGTEPLPPDEEAALRELASTGESILMEQKNHAKFSASKKGLADVLKERYEEKMFKRNWGWAIGGIAVFIAALWLTSAAVVAATSVVDMLNLGVALGAVATTILLAFLIQQASATGKCLLVAALFAFAALALATGFPILGAAFATGWYAPLVLPLLALPLVISAFFWIAAPTREGRAVLDRIAGFRQYLLIAEGERLDRLHPPKDTPALFERYLPYAIALGVENRWADRFRSVLAAAATQGQQQFGWYSGSSSPWRDTGGFVGRVGSSLASSVSSASTAPGSSSGSGGGGSSGGGGGGGGGGGW